METSLFESVINHSLPRAAQIVLQCLAKIESFSILLTLPNQQRIRIGQAQQQDTIALNIHDWRVFDEIITKGDIGFAKSYIASHWSCEQLAELLTLFAKHRAVLKQLIYGHARSLFWYRLTHFFRTNTLKGSQKNIRFHYDLGNDFYQLWLDPSMTYSSALFTESDAHDLHSAQNAKYRRILNTLALPKQAKVLEIGCGWGAFAELAAKEYQLQIVGITLSEKQLQYAQQRIQKSELTHAVVLLYKDYRKTEQRPHSFDAIVSIEMFEAVGERYWNSYFKALFEHLKPGGLACIQTITIADELFSDYRKGTDFIQQYIFPGGMLPSAKIFRERAQKAGFTIIDEYSFGQDYAKTLNIWGKHFLDKKAQLKPQYDDEFLRMWEFYLAYCEAGFLAENINVTQFTLRRMQ